MRYAEYKQTDQAWYPDIPSHWEYGRAKRMFDNPKEKNDGNIEDNVLSLTLRGVIRNNKENPIGLAPADYSTYQIFEENDLVFKLIDLENISTSRVGLVPERGIMSSAYIRFAARKDVNIRYFYFQYYDWWLRQVFNGLGAGVRQTLSASELLNLNIAIPPRDEQDQIVCYLDWQLSKINKLIHGYQKEIKLLEERKITIINNAVTKGLNSIVEYKPVESNWIGDIPSHWSFGAIKQHFQIQKRIAGKEGYDVLSITQQGLRIKNVASNEGQIAASYANYQFVYPGDFAMNHMDLLTGYVGLSEHFGVTSPDYRVFTITDTDNCNPEYYLYVFQLCYKRRIFYGLGKGAANKGRWRMPAINFRNFIIPIPPMKEQIEIVAFIKEQEKKIDELIVGIEKNIEFLKEYRTRLISDVVTGQMDVRGIEIPDYTPEDDIENDSSVVDDTIEGDNSEKEDDYNE